MRTVAILGLVFLFGCQSNDSSVSTTTSSSVSSQANVTPLTIAEPTASPSSSPSSSPSPEPSPNPSPSPSPSPSPTPHYVYVSCGTSIIEFAIDDTNGHLSHLPDGPVPFVAGNTINAIKFHPTKNFLYTVNSNSTISVLSWNATNGDLAVLSNNTVTTAVPSKLGFDSNGTFYDYLPTGPGYGGYSVATDGSLTYLAYHIYYPANPPAGIDFTNHTSVTQGAYTFTITNSLNIEVWQGGTDTGYSAVASTGAACTSIETK